MRGPCRSTAGRSTRRTRPARTPRTWRSRKAGRARPRQARRRADPRHAHFRERGARRGKLSELGTGRRAVRSRAGSARGSDGTEGGSASRFSSTTSRSEPLRVIASSCGPPRVMADGRWRSTAELEAEREREWGGGRDPPYRGHERKTRHQAPPMPSASSSHGPPGRPAAQRSALLSWATAAADRARLGPRLGARGHGGPLVVLGQGPRRRGPRSDATHSRVRERKRRRGRGSAALAPPT